MALYVDNAIFWAQVRIRGGWKNVVTLSIGYTLIILFCLLLGYELAQRPADKRFVIGFAETMVLVIQLVMLLVMCTSQVTNFIRRDITGRQIESNRLMPLGPAQAVAGYIAGNTVHLLALSTVNLVVGAMLVIMQGLPLNDWLVVNGIILLFCVSMWTAAALSGFVSRLLFGLFAVVCAVITFSGGTVFAMLPGLLTFCTPMQNRTMFQAASVSRMTPGLIVGMIAQMLMAILCVRAAARKYADSGAATLTLAPALVALGIWAGLSWFGIAQFHVMRPPELFMEVDWHLPLVGSLASCLLLAMLPVAAVAWDHILRQQRGAPALRAWMFWAALPVCVLFVMLPMSSRLNEEVLYGQMNYTYTPPVVRVGGKIIAPPAVHYVDHPILSYGMHAKPLLVAGAAAIFLVQTYFLMRLLYPRIRRPNLLLSFIVLMTWLLPLLADLIYYALQPGSPNPRMDHFAVMSPVGTIIQAIDNPARRTAPGLLAQAALAMIPLSVFLIIRARRLAGSAPREPQFQASVA